MAEIKVWRASDFERGDHHAMEWDGEIDIVAIAYRIGECRSGEIVTLCEVDGKEVDDEIKAYWDSCHREYREYRPFGKR